MDNNQYFIAGTNIRLSELSHYDIPVNMIQHETDIDAPEETHVTQEEPIVALEPTIATEADPDNKEHYIFKAPENPYFKFDDVCAEILAKDIRSKYEDLDAVESYFQIHFNDFEKEKYGEQILKIMNTGLGELAESYDRILQDFIAIYFSKPQPDYNACVKYDIKSAKSGYIDAVNNIRYRLDDWKEYELLFKYLIASQQIEYQRRWYNSKQFNPYKIWCDKLDKCKEFRQPALWSLCIGYSKDDNREYIVEQLTEYLDENIGADYQELVNIFLSANPGFDPEKNAVPFLPKSQKILAGKMAYKRPGDCPVCKEDAVDVVPVSWLCSHMVCCGCHNSVYSSRTCPMCRGDIV